MKPFLRKTMIFLLLQLALYFCVHRLYLAEYPARNNFYAAVLDKQRLLQRQASPRLIFVGGSATVFGVNAGAVAARVHMHPVNMAVHIGFGLPFMLDQVTPFLRPGDVVVLSPEYDLFAAYYAGDPEVLAYVLENWPAAARFMEPRQLAAVLDRGILQRAGRVVRTVFGRSAAGLENTGPIYRRDSLDDNGDLDAAQFGRSYAQAGAVMWFSDPAASARVLRRLNEFQEACRRRNVQVFFSHAPIVDWCFGQYREPMVLLDARLREHLKIPMLDSLEEAVFATRLQFDTHYHLGREGRARRTKLLAERLETRLKTVDSPAPARN